MQSASQESGGGLSAIARKRAGDGVGIALATTSKRSRALLFVDPRAMRGVQR